MSSRIKNGYADGVLKDDLYAEIVARRDERAGKEGANLFDGITTGSTKDDLITALDEDDKQAKGGKTGSSSTVTAGGGTVETIPVPDGVLIHHAPVLNEQGTKLTHGASVLGNQSLLVVDVMQNRTVEVFLIEAKPFVPDANDPSAPSLLVFVVGAVSNSLMTAKQALACFALKTDGTVLFNARGFDDVSKTAEFDMVDIVKLIEHNHGPGAQVVKEQNAKQAEADKAAQKQAEQDRKDQAAKDKAAADAKKE